MTVRWEKVYVFISSTFDDMHAERDYLVKEVFPRLQEWCERRRLRLVDVDLRWGVTEADATENKRVVQVCLERIDACRPFFVCFLGQRRGWVPGRADIAPGTYEHFPGLAQHAGAASVTELEILHAFVSPLHQEASTAQRRAEHSFFYLRQPDYLASLPPDVPQLTRVYTNAGIEEPEARRRADAELERWRAREIPATGRPVHTYQARWDPGQSTPEIRLPLRCPSTAEPGSTTWQVTFTRWRERWAAAGIRVDRDGQILNPVERQKAEAHNARLAHGRLGGFTCEGSPLAYVVLADLQAAIQARYPDHVEEQTITSLQRELDQQARFLQTAVEGFVEREGDLDELDGYMEDASGRPFFLTASAGLGKTSLLARWVDRWQASLPGDSLHYRFIGASDGSTAADALLRSVLGEIQESAKLDEEIPADPQKLRGMLPGLLAAAGRRGRTVIVLDGLNQLETGMGDLAWLPLALPPGIRLVASFKRGEPLAESYYESLKAGGQAMLSGVNPFESLEDRRLLVRAYLSQYLKELDERHLEALIRSEGAGNPLYLKVILAELRVFGAFGDLGAKILEDFGTTPVSAFAALLRRLETDPAYSPVRPQDLVPRFFGWLAHARTGLTAEELARLCTIEGPANADAPGLAAEAVHGLLRQVRPYLSRREGRFGFFFESLKQAAVERYAPGEEKPSIHPETRTPKQWHASLAAFFDSQPLRDEAEQRPNRHKLAELAYQLAHAGHGEAFRRTLWDYSYLQARLDSDGIEELIADFGLAALAGTGLAPEEQRRLGLLQQALRLSAHALRADARQLPGQLTGRMLRLEEDEARNLLESARREATWPWLQPLSASLGAPGGPLLFTLSGHTELVRAVAMTPDGRLAVSASKDGTLKVWDLARGVQLRAFAGHKCDVRSVALAADGRLAVSAAGGDLKAWDVATGRELRTLSGHAAVVHAVALTPDGRLAVSADDDRTLRTWDVAAGAALRTVVTSHAHPIFSVAVAADGRLAISASQDNTLKVWDLASGRELRTLAGHTSLVRAVALSEDGRLAVSASSDGTLRVWDVTPGTEVRTLAGHPGSVVWTVALTPDGRLAVSGAGDSSLKVWDVASGRELCVLPGHADSVSAVALTPDGRLAVSGSWDRAVKMWDVAAACGKSSEGAPGRRAEPRHARRVNAVELTEDGRQAVSASQDGTLMLWDLESGKHLRSLSGHSDAVLGLRLTKDKVALSWSSGSDRSIRLWDLSTGRQLASLVGHNREVSAVDITTSGRFAVSGSEDGTVIVWDLAPCQPVRRLAGHRGRISAVTLSPTGQMAVTASYDATLKVWDVETGQELHTLVGHASSVHAVALTPDCRVAVSASSDTTLRVWDLARGRHVHTLSGHTALVRTVVVTPDGRLALSASQDNTLKVWDLEDGRELHTLAGHRGWVKAVAVTPDGKWALSIALDDVLKVWDVRRGACVANFCHDGAGAFALAAGLQGLAMGDLGGRMHFFRLEGLAAGPAIVTALSRGPRTAFGCPHCRTWSEVSTSALGTDLPCPHCGKVIRLNPFAFDADRHPVAAPWRLDH